jgi:hypothetical protein
MDKRNERLTGGERKDWEHRQQNLNSGDHLSQRPDGASVVTLN